MNQKPERPTPETLMSLRSQLERTEAQLRDKTPHRVILSHIVAQRHGPYILAAAMALYWRIKERSAKADPTELGERLTMLSEAVTISTRLAADFCVSEPAVREAALIQLREDWDRAFQADPGGRLAAEWVKLAREMMTQPENLFEE